MKTFKEVFENNEEKKYSNIIVKCDEEILIIKRANYIRKFRGLWGFPGGSVDNKDKNPKDAAIRELKEETGIKLTWNEEYNCKELKKIKNKDNSESYYYLVNLETKPSEIKLSREHSKFEWYKSNNKPYNWMPDVFQIIQDIL